jgi:hypothetical protein
MLVNNASSVFGYGRLPEYLRWTTTIEHQLYSAPKESPVVPAAKKGAAAGSAPVEIASVKSLDPAEKELTVEAWVMPETPNGVIISHGGPANGFALYLDNRRCPFLKAGITWLRC